MRARGVRVWRLFGDGAPVVHDHGVRVGAG
jgi:hypothetical protein